MLRLRTIFLKMTPPQILTLGFLAIIVAGTLLLSLPHASASHHATPLIDALFTATSAVCVTGLVVVDTGIHYSTFGELVILVLMANWRAWLYDDVYAVRPLPCANEYRCASGCCCRNQ